MFQRMGNLLTIVGLLAIAMIMFASIDWGADIGPTATPSATATSLPVQEPKSLLDRQTCFYESDGIRLFQADRCIVITTEGVTVLPEDFQPDKVVVDSDKIREVDFCIDYYGTNPCHTTSQTGFITTSSVYGKIHSVKVHFNLLCKDTAAPGVYLYNNDKNLCQALVGDVADRRQMKGGAFNVDTVSVVGDIQAELFMQPDFEGDSDEANFAGDHDIEDGGYLSVRVHYVDPCRQDLGLVVTFTFEENFRGDCMQFDNSTALSRVKNNVQSIMVPPGFEVVAYTTEDFEGQPSRVFEQNTVDPDVNVHYWSFEIRSVSLISNTEGVSSTEQ